MNGTEQRKHTTAVAVLEAQTAEAIEGLVVALTAERREREQGDRDVAAGVRAAIGGERTHRLTMADQQRSHVDLEDRITRGQFAAFRDRGFWSRLNWLLTGR